MDKPKNYPFVEPEIATLAKEKGYVGPSMAYYTGLNTSYPGLEITDTTYQNHNTSGNWPIDYKNAATAPLYQQLIDWFREEHDIHIIITPIKPEESEKILYDYWLVSGKETWEEWDDTNHVFYTYYEALSDAIKTAFKYI